MEETLSEHDYISHNGSDTKDSDTDYVRSLFCFIKEEEGQQRKRKRKSSMSSKRKREAKNAKSIKHKHKVNYLDYKDFGLKNLTNQIPRIKYWTGDMIKTYSGLDSFTKKNFGKRTFKAADQTYYSTFENRGPSHSTHQNKHNQSCREALRDCMDKSFKIKAIDDIVSLCDNFTRHNINRSQASNIELAVQILTYISLSKGELFIKECNTPMTQNDNDKPSEQATSNMHKEDNTHNEAHIHNYEDVANKEKVSTSNMHKDDHAQNEDHMHNNKDVANNRDKPTLQCNETFVDTQQSQNPISSIPLQSPMDKRERSAERKKPMRFKQIEAGHVDSHNEANKEPMWLIHQHMKLHNTLLQIMPFNKQGFYWQSTVYFFCGIKDKGNKISFRTTKGLYLLTTRTQQKKIKVKTKIEMKGMRIARPVGQPCDGKEHKSDVARAIYEDDRKNWDPLDDNDIAEQWEASQTNQLEGSTPIKRMPHFVPPPQNIEATPYTNTSFQSPTAKQHDHNFAVTTPISPEIIKIVFFLKTWEGAGRKIDFENCARKAFKYASQQRDLHQYDLLIFPCLYNNHRFVFVVDIKGKDFVFLDSLYSEKSAYHTDVRDLTIPGFITMWFEFSKINIDFTKFQNKYHVIPRQTNLHDCGVYTIKCMEL
uniref:Ubiquitin-like protease family profile domain-containing protein n=1 Tax=Oryza brachyantha TaxID=4533 RepID=J3KZZ1_ORYBR